MIENESQRPASVPGRRVAPLSARPLAGAPRSPATAVRGAARVRGPFVALALSAILIVGCGEGQTREAGELDGVAEAALPSPFVLGFLPSQRAEEIVPDARRLADVLSERLGVPVDIRTPTAYEPLIEGLRFQHVHAAFLDGGPAWIAHRRSGAEAVLAEVKDGSTHYWAEAFVRSDSDLETLEDLRGARVAFTSRTGSSGFLMPVGMLIEAGIVRPGGRELTDLDAALRRTFAATVYAGGYRQALEALLDGQVDVAFGAHDAPERFLSEEQREGIRTLHRFGRIPSHAVVVSGQLPPDARRALAEAMLTLNEEENLPLLRALYGVEGLEPVDTEAHLGEFGRALSALPGMERTLLERQP